MTPSKRDVESRVDDLEADTTTGDKSIAQFLSEIYVPPHERDAVTSGNVSGGGEA